MQQSGFPYSQFSRGFALMALAGVALSLAACNADTSMTRSFSQGAGTGDERRVGALPPLSLPPEYTLRPERPGVVRPVPAPASDAPLATGRTSAGQAALVDAAGPPATPGIRNQVNEDVRLEATQQGFTDELMSWQRPPDQPPVIQPKAASSGGILGWLF